MPRHYQELLKRWVNCAVAENAHKWYAMETQRGLFRDDEAKAVWRRRHDLGLPMRGHCVFWGIDKYVMPWVKELDRDALEATMQARAPRVIGLFRGKITEFDINTTDTAKQAEDTRRFYKLCFAHPAIEGILMWGFWEGAHWMPNAALWRKDWTPKPNGEAYMRLMEEWTTRGNARADAQGALHFRGFYGDYRLRSDERQWTVSLIRSRQGQTAEARLDGR